MKKGISLMVLGITVIVITVIAGVIVINTSQTVAETTKSKLKVDIAQLEALMNTYRIRKNGNIDFDKVKFDTSNLSEAEEEQFEGETVVGNKIEMYIIDLYEIDAESVNYGNLKEGTKDRYIYSLNTGKVYYEKGLLVNGITYYYVLDEE